MELAAPYESQAVVAAAIAGYRTFEETELAHSNCLRMLEFVHEQGRRVFLQSCLIALRHRMSFDFPIAPSIPPEGVKAAPALNREAAGAISLGVAPAATRLLFPETKRPRRVEVHPRPLSAHKSDVDG